MTSSTKTLSSAALFLSLNIILFSMFSSATATTCPIDAVKLNVCADVLGGLVSVNVATSPCCSLINGHIDLDAAVCFCNALKAGILGVIVDIPLSLKILLNDCGRTWPSGFTC